ncbi:Magnesium and cobalt transport protein CorA [hydrothermal vent metagenome]|uniref:Magnesium and cobalt transport protein CorA n=1 Tax=hydrothermal vent metagenome TaxID=652676 RepID=A0A3B1CU05_9ZZZZ
MELDTFMLNKNRYLEPSSVEAFLASRAEDGPFWVDITEPDETVLKEFLSPLQLHPLILETCLDPSAGSRIAPYEQALFIKLPTQPRWDRIEQAFLSIICLPHAIVTIHKLPIPALKSIAKEFSTAVRFHTQSTSAILYQILDRLIDEDMAYALKARREIESLEEAIDRDEAVDIDKALTLKRKVARLSITFEEQHHCVTTLQTIESEFFDIKDFREYYRDSLANLEYAIRSVNRQQTHLSEIRQHYIVTLQDRTNKRLRLLTIISAIFMPLTLIAGIYGMNFRYMPELKWHYGYPAVLAIMLAIAVGLLWIFHRRGWFR